MARIYRAQSAEHKYFIPTALREHNFSWLDKNIEVTEGIIEEIVPKVKEIFPIPKVILTIPVQGLIIYLLEIYLKLFTEILFSKIL